MQPLKNILLILLTAYGVCSCVSNGRILGKSETQHINVTFYAVSISGDKSSVSKIYAEVDSNEVKRFYSFYPDRILMTDERAKGLSYTLLFQRLPDSYDIDIYRPLSQVDTLVFSQANMFLSTSEYSHLKSPTGYAGFEIEVNYKHGFPKGRKFKPL